MTKLALLSGVILVFSVAKGVSQGQPAACDGSVSLGIITTTSSVTVDGTLDDPVPVCIRCGALVGLSVIIFTDTSNVEYQDSNGVALVNNTNGIIITEYGLLNNDPASSFTDGQSIVCAFNDGSMDLEYQITFDIIIFNPPPITPNVSVLNVVEGENTSLTCTGDTDINNDRYQWLLPDGTVFPENSAVADNGLVLQLNSITRSQSGVYTCMGTLVGSQTERDSNITVNVLYPASVIMFTPDTIVTVGSTLTLNCTFEANPVPSVSWSLNGTVLDTSSDPNYSTNIFNECYALLEINFATVNVGGEYACTVSNSLGVDHTITSITVQVVPGPVYSLVNTSSTQTCISLTWTFGFDGNSPITGVDISYEATDNFNPAHSGSTSTNTKEQTSITICNLQPLSTYEFTVTVRNEVSDTVGVSSPRVVSADTLPLVPGAPTLNSVIAIRSTILRVEWAINFNSNLQTSIEEFEVFYSAVGSSNTVSMLVNDGDATMVDITGLAKGTRYSVTVVASNSAGMSVSSNALVARTSIDTPGPVQNLVLTSNPFSLCVDWSEPSDDGGQDVVNYKIDIWNRDLYEMENFTFVTKVGTAVLTYVIEKLLNNTNYSIQVTPNNTANGEGGLGTSAVGTATTGSTLIHDLEFVVRIDDDPTSFSVQVSWTVGIGQDNVEFRIQIIEEDDSFNPNEYTSFGPSNRSAVIDGLDGNTTYKLRMIRIASGGCTRRISDIVYFETQDPATTLSLAPGNTTLTVGSTLTLNCTFEGDPSSLVWFHNGTQLDASSDPNYSERIVSNSNALLSITFTTINVSGMYACGKDEIDSIFITVQVAPGPVYMLMNTSTNQTCTSLAWTFGFDGNSPITGVDISYEATDNFNPAHSGSTSTNTKEQTAITICNLQPLTTYEFTVTVRNEVKDIVGVSSPRSISTDTLEFSCDSTDPSTDASSNPAVTGMGIGIVILSLSLIISISINILQFCIRKKSQQNKDIISYANSTNQLSFESNQAYGVRMHHQQQLPIVPVTAPINNEPQDVIYESGDDYL